MRKSLQRLAFVAVILVLPAVTPGAVAETVSTEEALSEKVMGAADAPNVIIEYASLTCPHCAAFHRDTLPELKKQYLDTGKAKLIYRDFPLDGAALRASMLARCSGDSRYFRFVDTLFKTQNSWSRSNDPVAALTQVGRMGGLTKDEIDACLKNEALMDGILEIRLGGQQEYDVSSTPTFIINGRKVSGALPFAEFEKYLTSD